MYSLGMFGAMLFFGWLERLASYRLLCVITATKGPISHQSLGGGLASRTVRFLSTDSFWLKKPNLVSHSHNVLQFRMTIGRD